MSVRSLSIVILSLAGCTSSTKSEAQKPAAETSKPAITNRVEVPPAVRQNLGITFAVAEERAVGESMRLAGHFGLPKSARLPHHTALPGVVQVHVALLDRVKEGQLLASVASPELLEHRHQLHLASDAIGVARDGVATTSDEVAEASAALAHLRKRNVRLRKVGAPNADLQSQEAALKQRVRVLKGKRKAKRHEVTRAEHRFDAELLAFSAMLGVSADELREDGNANVEHGDKKPRWETVDRVNVRAARTGIVTDVEVSTGAWVGEGAKLVELRDPSAVWLVARALDSDTARLRDGQRVRIIPTGRSTTKDGPAITGSLRVGLSGDKVGRTVPVYVTLDSAPEWARPGSAAFVEVAVQDTSDLEVAIPLGALVRDGLQDVFFRRDPADPDKVIRVEADRGTSDGRWVVMFSGIAAGDEVVVDGAYELKLASTAKPNVVGHFHADGTFHEGKE